MDTHCGLRCEQTDLNKNLMGVGEQNGGKRKNLSAKDLSRSGVAERQRPYKDSTSWKIYQSIQIGVQE